MLQALPFIKVLFMPILMFVIWQKNNLKTKPSKYLFAGVFLGWWGDIFLISNDNMILFLLGLIAFLIGHLFYIYLFSKEVSSMKRPHLIMNKPYLILPYLLFFIYSVNLFSVVTQVPKLPIYLYAFVIILMSIMALNRWYAVKVNSWISVFLGSLFFILSDFLIAIHYFIHPFKNSSMAIMSTYLIAQLLIVYGVLKNDNIVTKS
ncbi:MAG: lysoplasmalogenase [Chitinophagales bacterium]|nr:lysoplasmalogenase [Chitinophagales bacterium]